MQSFDAGSPDIAGLDDKVQVIGLTPQMEAVKLTVPPAPLTCVTLGVKLVTFGLVGAAPARFTLPEPSTATRPENKSVAAARHCMSRERTASPYDLQSLLATDSASQGLRASAPRRPKGHQVFSRHAVSPALRQLQVGGSGVVGSITLVCSSARCAVRSYRQRESCLARTVASCLIRELELNCSLY